MKRLITFILALVCVLGLGGCNNKTANIDFPFDVEDVENVEMYHFVGVPMSLSSFIFHKQLLTVRHPFRIPYHTTIPFPSHYVQLVE